MNESVVVYQKERAVGVAGSAAVNASDVEDLRLFTLGSVKMIDDEFDLEGPFDLRIGIQLFGPCSVENFRRLRPGYTYDRVLFKGPFKKQLRIESSEPTDSEKKPPVPSR